MDEKKNEIGLKPYAAGVVGAVAGFSYGMKQEKALIDQALTRITDPTERVALEKKVTAESLNIEAPFVSHKTRSQLRDIIGEKPSFNSRLRSPLGFCLGAGLTCFFATTALASMFSKSPDLEK